MRILIWYWGRRGGGAQFTLSLARALAEDGNHQTAVSIACQNDLLPRFRGLPAPRQEVSTYQSMAGFGLGFARIPVLARRLGDFAQEMRADVVLSTMTHTWTPLIAPYLVKAGLNFVPVLHDGAPRQGDFEPFWSWRLNRELAVASAAVVMSDHVARAVKARRPDVPLIRLPLGAHLPPAQDVLQPPCDVLFFGRLRGYKGLDLLRDAWPLVREAHPAATLRVVGIGDDKALAPGLADLPGVSIERRWVPNSEIRSLITSARLLVLPYHEASQSGVLPQAMALGVPVVATCVGGLTEQMKGGGGVLVRPTPDALGLAIARLLEPEAHFGAAQEARARSSELSDWAAISTQLRSALSAHLHYPAA
ncbi:MAG: glycosyltransferase family 4 protein [Alphaproteobacteria bacterium]|nr:glycosyltransferase family 4 protein [Alphaproteobacteria bacterium]